MTKKQEITNCIHVGCLHVWNCIRMLYNQKTYCRVVSEQTFCQLLDRQPYKSPQVYRCDVGIRLMPSHSEVHHSSLQNRFVSQLTDMLYFCAGAEVYFDNPAWLSASAQPMEAHSFRAKIGVTAYSLQPLYFCIGDKAYSSNLMWSLSLFEWNTSFCFNW